MWITEQVEIADALFRAAIDGELVVFVGAGASVPPPSSLPLFGDLARSVAREALVDVRPADLRVPDELLGRLEDADVDVRRRVASLLNRPSSEPNATHEAIARLFPPGALPRVVTTNYDTHLTSALRAEGRDFHVYEAPTLPSGGDFSGVVHIHGSLHQDPRHLVVTDRDFGRAYLSEAWATRFLSSLFSKFVVVFVGYSHNDTVMRYLARGLVGESRRFALVSHLDDERRWAALGIQAVTYPEHPKNDHSALPAALEAWGPVARRTLVDHNDALTAFSHPPASAVDDSYLRYLISHPVAVRLVCQHIDASWLPWLSTTSEFHQLLTGSAERDSRSTALAEWFATNCLGLDDATLARADVLDRQGTPATLSRAIAFHLARRRGDEPLTATHAVWVQRLIASAAHTGVGGELEQILRFTKWPEDRETALLLLDELLSPRVTRRPGFLSPTPHTDIDLGTEGYWLREAWREVIHPHLSECATPVLMMCVRHILSAHAALAATGQADAEFDALSSSRSAIERHDQDEHEGALGVLIDAARDSLVSLIASRDAIALGMRESFGDAPQPLLRRLAAFAWATDPNASGDDRLTWVLARPRLLYDLSARHEVFQLLGATSDASTANKERLLEEIRRGPDVAERDVSDYEVYNALAWMSRVDPYPAWAAAFDDVQNAHPDFGVRDHPDFNSWMGEAEWIQPVPVENLEAAEPSDALAMLQEARADDGPAGWRRDVRESVHSVVSASPTWGIRVAQSLTADAAWEDETWPDLFYGWARAPLAREDWLEILALARSHPSIEGSVRELAQLLSAAVAPESALPVDDQSGTLDLARRLAACEVDAPPRPEGAEWLSAAINHWAGDLAEYALRLLANLRSAGVSVPSDMWTLLEAMVDSTGALGSMSRPVLGGNLHFLYAVDADWTSRVLVPHFRWTDDEAKAAQVWDGFLTWGRWTKPTARALRTGFIELFAHARSELPKRVARISDHAAVLVTRHPKAPLPNMWFERWVVALEDEERADLVAEVGRTLRPLSVVERDKQWERWIADYWQRRLDGVPRRLGDREAAGLLHWVLPFTAHFADAVSLAVQMTFKTDRHHGLLMDERLTERVESDPSAAASFLLHVLRSTDGYLFHADELRTHWQRLAASGGVAVAELQAIQSEAIRLGCLVAATWTPSGGDHPVR